MGDLKFAEVYPYASTGARVFEIKMEKEKIIGDLDLFARFSKNYGYNVTRPVLVSDGILNIDFYSDRGNAKVSAILVTRNAQEKVILPTLK